MKATPRHKRIILVNRDFQFRYTRAGVAIGIVSTVLTSVVILYPLYLFKILVIAQFLPTPILAGMAAAALINIAMLVLFGILISHRVAGPMFSMVRHFRKIANGHWRTQMRTRPGDDLQFVIRNLNDLSAGLVETAEKDLALIDQAINVSADPSAIKEYLTQLRYRIAKRIEAPAPDLTATEEVNS